MGRREEPLSDGPLRDFAQSLRDLRTAAGSPTYRALERKAGFSASALSAAAKGERLPTLEVTLAYVGACGGDVQAWETRWQELAASLEGTHPGLLPTPGSAGRAGRAAAALGPADPVSIGPFVLEGRLGAGTMGQVYLGRTAAGRPVAVKVIHPALAGDAQFRRRFTREVAAIRRVQGLFTAAVVDADPDADQPWLATAYIPGPTLAQRLEDDGPLSPAETERLAAGVAEALKAIHAAGLVHRDLKPSNVILAEDGVKVIDFGIAHVADGTTLTVSGAMLGSAGFMAPECVEDASAVGPPADVFAVGCLLVYALTGTPPFGQGTPAAVLYRIVHSEPDLGAVSSLDNNLHDLIADLLAKDPAARPTPTQILARLGADAAGAQWSPGPAADPDRGGTLAKVRPLLRPRLGLAPLLLVLAIITVYAIAANGQSSPNMATPPQPSISTLPLTPTDMPASTPSTIDQPTAATTTVSTSASTADTADAAPPPSTASETTTLPASAPPTTPHTTSTARAGTVYAAVRELKAPDFDGYCRTTGQGGATLNTSLHGYGWRCTADNGTGDDVQAVCQWTNHTTQVTNRIADFNDPNSWQCWAAARDLGPIAWDTYCQDKGWGHVADAGKNNVYTWYCTGTSNGLDSQDACLTLYGSNPPISRFQNFYDKNTWQCWG